MRRRESVNSHMADLESLILKKLIRLRLIGMSKCCHGWEQGWYAQWHSTTQGSDVFRTQGEVQYNCAEVAVGRLARGSTDTGWNQIVT